jgi:hypothetical protein
MCCPNVTGGLGRGAVYRDAGDAFSIAARGGGSLVASVFSANVAFLARAALELGPHHAERYRSTHR